MGNGPEEAARLGLCDGEEQAARQRGRREQKRRKPCRCFARRSRKKQQDRVRTRRGLYILPAGEAGLHTVSRNEAADLLTPPVLAEFLPRTPVRQPAWSCELMRDYWG
jgi:hypothetical protein